MRLEPSLDIQLTLAQEEKTQNNLRWKLYGDLRDLETFMPSLDGGPELFDKYRDMSTNQSADTDTLIDEFAEPILKIVPTLGSIPALKPIDMSTTAVDLDKARETADFAGADADEYDEEAVGESEEHQVDLTVPGEDEVTTQFDPVSEQEAVKDEALSWYESTPIFFYPDWRGPATGPVFFRTPNPGEVLEASQDTEASQTSQVEAEPKPRTGM